jgi:RNA polymerase sigma-70 factor (ECF subfamily)
LFPPTAWSAISQARRHGAAGTSEALRRLVVEYWRPLYIYLRRRGESHEDAADSVQGFFEFVFSSGFFSHVDREGGKFRSYLLRSLERWRSRQQRREDAQKRGGQVARVSLEGLDEMEVVAAGVDVDPERAFDRQWASDMVARAMRRVGESYQRRGRGEWFEALRPGLPGGGGLASHAETAVALGATEGAVKKAVFDLRRAFAEELRSSIRATVLTAEDAEEELRHLVAVMGGE